MGMQALSWSFIELCASMIGNDSLNLSCMLDALSIIYTQPSSCEGIFQSKMVAFKALRESQNQRLLTRSNNTRKNGPENRQACLAYHLAATLPQDRVCGPRRRRLRPGKKENIVIRNEWMRL
jgi:hypothetical protein